KYIRIGAFIVGSLFLLCLVSILTLYIVAKVLGPPKITVPETTIFYDKHNQVIGEVSAGGERHWVPLKDISPAMIQATLSIEDRYFYQHHGFDLKRIAGAIVADIKAGARVQGASTITQQYAKNLYLGQEKTLQRKLIEAWYTIRLETNYSKNQILE